MIGSKLKAAAIHGVVTVFIALIAGALVYIIWYPGAFAKMLNGTDLYLIVMGVELCLGPLMSLVIFNPNKPRLELIRDYFIVIIVQLSALFYGLYSVALSRPIYMVFVKDRIEIVVATELDPNDLRLARDDSFKSVPWFGPESICTESPTDPKEKSDLLLSGLAGKDIQLMPRYYRNCKKDEIIKKTQSKNDLFKLTKIQNNDLPSHLRAADFTWLPVVTRFNAWIVVYVQGDVKNPTYVNLNPFN